MKYSNNLNLPSALVKAVTRDSYVRGDASFTTTELIGPPRIRYLKRKHDHEIVEDVSSVLYRLCGSIGHGIIERAGGDNSDIIERRFKASFTVDGKEYTVSGQADLVREEDGQPYSIWDWKFTSLYSFRDGVKPEYIAQLNILKLLSERESGFKVAGLFSGAIYRDWSKAKASRTSDYPQEQVGVFPVEAWNAEETEAFIKERIRVHVAAETELPECTNEDRWADPTTYACVKPGGVRALPGGIFETRQDAMRFAAEKGAMIQERRGTSKRCADYCSAAAFCSQWQALKVQEESL